MNVYCYEGSEKDVANLFQTITLTIDISDDDFNFYYGYSESDVKQAQKNQKSFFSFNFFSQNKKRDFLLNPFNQTCIGIETASEYKVMLKKIRMDITKILLFIIGIVVFFLASKLSQNEIFFYLSGMILGVLTSVLILIWFLSKLIPKVCS
jgi:NEMP family